MPLSAQTRNVRSIISSPDIVFSNSSAAAEIEYRRQSPRWEGRGEVDLFSASSFTTGKNYSPVTLKSSPGEAGD